MTLSSVGVQNGVRNSDELRSFAQTSTVLDVPNLIQVQLDSFEWFKTDGLRELFEEISPIEDFPGGRFQLTFEGHQFEDPKQTEEECRERETTFSAPLYVTVGLHTKGSGPGEGEIKYQKLFIGDIPMMTTTGTFIINGAERVVVSQLVRSPGVYFTTTTDPTTGRVLASAKLIPIHGAWMEFDTDKRDVLSVKVDRKRKTPVTMLLRAIGFTTDDEIRELFEDVDIDPDHPYIQTTIEKDTVVGSEDEALLEFYRRLRPGEPPSVENAKTLLENLFYNPRRYDLGRVGRYKLNRKLGPPGDQDESARTLSRRDIVNLLRGMILVNRGEREADDIDHLGNRRVRAVGELIQNHIRVGLMRMERVIKERMTTQVDPATTTPAALINIRPVVASVREFFGGSQLSQFMDQTNPLAELTHKRRLSALGPGGLSRDRAGFDVRDVHPSHYGRICPIETPEGPNIGLLGSLATYARTNNHGFIETPYRRVQRDILSTDPDFVGRTVDETIVGTDGRTILNSGGVVSKGIRTRISKIPEQRIAVRPYVASDIAYLTADEEDEVVIAQANSKLNDKGEFVGDNGSTDDVRVESRIGRISNKNEKDEFVDDDGNMGDVRAESRIIRTSEEVGETHPKSVQFMDVSPMQLVSVSTALIPFLEHNDASRALLGSNMQRQAVPLLRPEAPLVGTGMEKRVAVDSGQVILSRSAGVVTEVTGSRIVITDGDGEQHEYKLKKFVRSNQGTCINQHPIVDRYDRVAVGDILADSSSTSQGELALGHNVLVAFMSWEGYNFEDAIILSESMVRQDKFTSIHIEKHEVEARDTKLGPEEITRDIPNVGEDSLRNLDEEGVIRIGAEIGPGDILVGKITPKGETELSAEEKLLRAIFGEKARDVKDSSLRVPHGERGKVIEVQVLKSPCNKACWEDSGGICRCSCDSRNHGFYLNSGQRPVLTEEEQGPDLPPGVSMLVRLWIAQTRKVTEGDKMANRHGNKGVISKILPEEDMPYLADGTPVDIILNPIGVPSRMNLGQVLETHLGMAAHALGYRAVTPVFDGAVDDAIENGLAQSWLIEQSGAVDPRPLNGDGPSRVNLAKTRDWLGERGYDFDDVMVKNGLGKAREACLKIWFEEEMGMDMTGHSVDEMKRAALELDREHQVSVPILGKSNLFDGRTGEPFDQPIAVGYIYMLKLIHLVEDKIHARSTGPYSLITQQPLGGKAQFGGQRFGEMEVWALEAYSAAYNLQEMLTVKSDDVVGRVKTYEAIVKGDDTIQPGIPESFHVLVKELQSLGLSVELIYEQPDVDMGLPDEPTIDDLMDGVASLSDPAAIPGFDDLGPMPSEIPSFDDKPETAKAEQPVSQEAETVVEEPSEATGGDG